MADQPASNSAKGGGDPFNMVKALRAKQNSETGSANGGSGSDNSALVSFGNNSFGFNFDSEEGTRPDSEKNDSSSDNEVTNIMNSKVPATVSSASTGARSSQAGKSPKSSISSLTNSSGGGGKSDGDMAASASSNLKSIATLCMQQGAKRKAADNDSGGYNTDDDDDQAAKVGSQAAASSSARSSKDSVSSDLSSPKGKKKRRLDKDKREERNAREKERSFRISKQINELRDLLSSGGVIVPKGTKSSVLTEAANYIRTLQQHHYRSEIDRHQLIQQMQLIGNGAHGPQAAAAIRHVAAQNGVWSLGNFGGVPPKSAMSFYQSSADSDQQAQQGMQPTKVESSDYRYIFSSCGVGMAIASMGGAFIDCNQLFSQLSNYTKQELCSLTIFNLTSRQDLQHAFDLISQMISPPMDSRQDLPKPIVLRGAMKNRNDLGLCITLVKGEDGIAKCFCVTLIKNPASPFDTSTPIPVSFESVLAPSAGLSGMTKEQIESTPAFTSG